MSAGVAVSGGSAALDEAEPRARGRLYGPDSASLTQDQDAHDAVAHQVATPGRSWRAELPTRRADPMVALLSITGTDGCEPYATGRTALFRER